MRPGVDNHRRFRWELLLVTVGADDLAERSDVAGAATHRDGKRIAPPRQFDDGGPGCKIEVREPNGVAKRQTFPVQREAAGDKHEAVEHRLTDSGHAAQTAPASLTAAGRVQNRRATGGTSASASRLQCTNRPGLAVAAPMKCRIPRRNRPSR